MSFLPPDACFDEIRNARRPCALLMGAGCSVSANIPAASKLIEAMRELHPGLYRDLPVALQNDYNAVTSRLMDPLEFVAFINGYIEKARVNYAHLCIAELMKAHKIERVLTTNFDPLLLRACSMVRYFPAMFDCAAASAECFERVYELEMGQVYYLHGQSYGLRMLNSRDELSNHGATVRTILDRVTRGRNLVVVGYSGKCDEVLNKLETESKVFWIAHTEKEGEEIQDKLRGERRYVVAPYDADHFFRDLMGHLEVAMPKVVLDPVGYFNELTQEIAPLDATQNAGVPTGGNELEGMIPRNEPVPWASDVEAYA